LEADFEPFTNQRERLFIQRSWRDRPPVGGLQSWAGAATFLM